MVFIYIFFFLLKMSALFHSSKITALVQQLKLHLADLLAKKKWLQFIHGSESGQLASEK